MFWNCILASQTVWGTFESQILLRRLTLFGAHLFLPWCLSPLGGQASLRILEITTAAQINSGEPILYLPTGGMNSKMVFSLLVMRLPLCRPSTLYIVPTYSLLYLSIVLMRTLEETSRSHGCQIRKDLRGASCLVVGVSFPTSPRLTTTLLLSDSHWLA